MHVVALWRFPVKSLQGEQLQHAVVDQHGLIGDRQWAIADDTTGFTLTARREPKLLFASATIIEDRPRITLDDGTTPRTDDDLSDWLGRRVHLVEAGRKGGLYETPVDPENEDDGEWRQWRGPGGAFHDSARTKVSLVSTTTLGAWDPRRFRANIVLDRGEDDLVGATVAIGSVELSVVKQIDRCVVVTRAQPGIVRDLDVFRTINRDRATYLGVGAMVTRPGRMLVGDELGLRVG